MNLLCLLWSLLLLLFAPSTESRTLSLPETCVQRDLYNHQGDLYNHELALHNHKPAYVHNYKREAPKSKPSRPRKGPDEIVPARYFQNLPDPTTVFRADARPLISVLQSGGFFPRTGRATPQKYSVYAHVQGEIANTAYVSTTDIAGDRLAFYAENARRVPTNTAQKAYIYQIENSKNFVDVNKSLRLLNVALNSEHAAMGGIPASQVKAYVEATDHVLELLKTGRAREIKWTPSTEYKPLPVALKGSSVRPELAGWPEGHEAWGEEPWKELMIKNKGPVTDVSSRFKKVLAPMAKRIPGLEKGIKESGGEENISLDRGGPDGSPKPNRAQADAARRRLQQRPSSGSVKRPHESDSSDDTGSESDDSSSDSDASSKNSKKKGPKPGKAPKQPQTQPSSNTASKTGSDIPRDDSDSGSGSDKPVQRKSRAARTRDWLLRKNKKFKPDSDSPRRHDDRESGKDDSKDGKNGQANTKNGQTNTRPKSIQSAPFPKKNPDKSFIRPSREAHPPTDDHDASQAPPLRKAHGPLPDKYDGKSTLTRRPSGNRNTGKPRPQSDSKPNRAKDTHRNSQPPKDTTRNSHPPKATHATANPKKPSVFQTVKQRVKNTFGFKNPSKNSKATAIHNTSQRPQKTASRQRLGSTSQTRGGSRSRFGKLKDRFRSSSSSSSRSGSRGGRF